MIDPLEIEIRDLPHNVKSAIMSEALIMLNDLSYQCLEVVLIPAIEQHFEGHSVRTVIDQNPDWYRHYFGYRRRKGQYNEWYGSSSHIRRRIIKSLERIYASKDKLMFENRNNKYRLDGILRAIICKRLGQGYISYLGEQIPSNDFVFPWLKKLNTNKGKIINWRGVNV